MWSEWWVWGGLDPFGGGGGLVALLYPSWLRSGGRHRGAHLAGWRAIGGLVGGFAAAVAVDLCGFIAGVMVGIAPLVWRYARAGEDF